MTEYTLHSVFMSKFGMAFYTENLPISLPF